MKQTFVDLQKRLSLNSPETPTSMFDEFYISFGQNEYQIGVNIKFDDTYTGTNKQVYKDNIIKSGNTVGQTSILIKLVDALPSKFDISSRLYVATKPAESQAYLVEFPYDKKEQPWTSTTEGLYQYMCVCVCVCVCAFVTAFNRGLAPENLYTNRGRTPTVDVHGF